jgi:hypothetical protein
MWHGYRRGRQHSTSRCCIFAGVASWSDEKVLAKVRDMVFPEIMSNSRSGAIHSVLMLIGGVAAVARQAQISGRVPEIRDILCAACTVSSISSIGYIFVPMVFMSV